MQQMPKEEKMKKRIIVDMDCILTDLFTPIFRILDKEFGIRAAVEDLTQWDMVKCSPLDQMPARDLYGIFRRPGFFRNLEPLPGALEGFRSLYDAGHELVIVSTPTGPESAGDKYRWLAEHLPYLPEKDVFLGSHKHMVKADVIIDDRGETLERYHQEWPQALCLGIHFPYNTYLLPKANPSILLCGSHLDTEKAWGGLVEVIEAL